MNQINLGDDEQKIFLAYQPPFKKILFIILSILTIGFLNILIYWKRKIAFVFYTITNDIHQADVVLISKGTNQSVKELKIQKDEIWPHKHQEEFIYFKYNKHAYVFDEPKFKFRYFESLKEELVQNPLIFQKYKNGLEEQEVNQIRKMFGKNLIEVKVPNPLILLVQEIFSPFYFYQSFCIVVWFLDEYAYYAYAVIILSAISVVSTVIEQWRARRKIRKLAYQEIEVEVTRKNNEGVSEKKKISSIELVPGDIISLVPDMRLPCDILIIEGECIVNEGMLTGESTPIKKSEYEQSQQIKSANILLSGTECMVSQGQKENLAFGLVLSTGFNTFKGELIWKILLQEVDEFRFHRDAFRYLFITFCITTIGVIWYFIYVTQNFEQSLFKTFIKAFELYTTSVPPILPLCLTLGLQFGVQSLKKKKIQTLLMGKINQAGRIRVMCFDKTGTLTENDLIFKGYISINEGKLSEMQETISEEHFNSSIEMYEIFSCCHNLGIFKEHPVGDPLEVKMFNQTQSNLVELKGNNDMKKMIVPSSNFKKLLSSYYQTELGDFVYQIIRVSEFSSERKMSSTLFYNPHTSQYKLAAKGAPQIIMKKCKPETIPNHFNQLLDQYSKEGYRIIGLASKNLSFDEIETPSETLEQDMDFQGLLFFENSLKKQTIPTIQTLINAKIKNVMITGDALLTALHVAYNCNIISSNKNVYVGELDNQNQINWTFYESKEMRDKQMNDLSVEIGDSHLYSVTNIHMEQSLNNSYHSQFKQSLDGILEKMSEGNSVLALSGDCFFFLFKNFLESQEKRLKILLNFTKVYARTSPDQKAFIVKCLKKSMEKKKDEFVGFCGDGANDCSALQCSHVGLSLSEMDASIASPFVSTVDNISTILDLIIEGKACLASGIQSFQYISTVCLFEFFAILFLYYLFIDFSNGNYYLIDIFTIFPFTILITIFTSIPVLTKEMPHSNIFNSEIMISLFGHLTINFLFNIFCVQYYVVSPIYISSLQIYPVEEESMNVSFFLVSQFGISGICSFGCLFGAWIFCKGHPFKREWWFSILFVAFSILNLIFQIFFLFAHSWFQLGFQRFLNEFYMLSYIPNQDKIFFLVIFILELQLMYLHERYLVPILTYSVNRILNRRKMKKTKKLKSNQQLRKIIYYDSSEIRKILKKINL